MAEKLRDAVLNPLNLSVSQAPSARRFARAKVKVLVRIVFRKKERTVSVLGQGVDIGRGGLAVLVPVELSLGSRVTLEFHLPKPLGSFQLAAIVRNRMECFYGVEFLDRENGVQSGTLPDALNARSATAHP
jgi:hypothetical protein